MDEKEIRLEGVTLVGIRLHYERIGATPEALAGIDRVIQRLAFLEDVRRIAALERSRICREMKKEIDAHVWADGRDATAMKIALDRIVGPGDELRAFHGSALLWEE